MRPPSHIRIRRGLSGHALAQAAGFAIQLAGVPLYIHFWGVALYGEWLMLVALQGWLLSVDLGYSATAVNEAAMRAAGGDIAGAQARFQSAWVAVTALLLAAAGVAAAVLATAPVATWLGFSELGPDGTVNTFALLVVQAFLHIQAGLLGAGLTAAGQYGLLAFLMMFIRTAGFALVALAVVLGGGPEQAALALALAELAGLGAIAALARRHSPWLRAGWARATFSDMRRLAGPSFGVVGLSIGNALVIQGPVVVIGAALGPTAAAVFSTLRFVARAPLMLAGIPFATLRAEAALAHGAGEHRRLRGLNTQAVQCAAWLGAVALAVLLSIGPWAVAIWSGGEILVRQPLFGLLIVTAMATMLWTGAGTALMATNRSQRMATAYAPISAVALAGTAVFAPRLGLDGAAAVLAVSEWLVAALVVRRALTFVDQRAGALARAASRPPIDLIGQLRLSRRR